MNEDWSAQRWANQLTQLLDMVQADDRYPVKVPLIAREYSRQVFPDDPIEVVKGAPLEGFEGGLYPAPATKGKGWGIIYNSAIASAGRINFTLGHEFGHYLIHRRKYPDGIECDPKAMLSWDSEYAQVEAEANAFAAGILMPLHDYRRLISADGRPTLDQLGECAARYDVSLIAAALRWLEYTSRRAVLVVSRDGFVKWARSSKKALKTGAFIRTKNVSPVPVPPQSLAARALTLTEKNQSTAHDQTVWFNEPSQELILQSDRFDFAISLIHLDDRVGVGEFGDEEYVHDTYNQFQTPRRGLFGEE